MARPSPASLSLSCSGGSLATAWAMGRPYPPGKAWKMIWRCSECGQAPGRQGGGVAAACGTHSKRWQPKQLEVAPGSFCRVNVSLVDFRSAVL